jgi:hypothetical protein
MPTSWVQRLQTVTKPRDYSSRLRLKEISIICFDRYKPILHKCPLAPTWELAPTFSSIGLISQFLDHSQTIGLLGRVISSSQGLYLNTGQLRHRKTHTRIKHPCPEWDSNTRSRLPSKRISTCLRPLGYRDRHFTWISSRNPSSVTGLISTSFASLLTFFSMALQPPSALSSAFQFHDHFTYGRTPWTSDQLVARPLPKHRTTQT